MKLPLDILPFAPGEFIASRIPDVNEMRESGIAGATSLIEASWRAGTLWTQQIAEQRILGTIGNRIGYVFPNEFNLVKNAILQPITEVGLEVARELSRFLQNTLESAVSVAAREVCVAIANSVPIIGIVVEAAFGIAKLVRQGLENAKNYGKVTPTVVTPPSFSPRLDEDLYNQFVLARVTRSNDWSKIFMPQGLGLRTSDFSDRFSVDVTRALGPNNFYVYPSDANFSNGVGCVPGTSFLFNGWTGSGGVIQQTGIFTPTAQYEGTLLWGQINKPSSPSTYMVDAGAIMRAWHSFFENLFGYLTQKTRGRELSENFKRHIWRDYVSAFGGQKEKTGRKGDFAWSGNYGADGTIPVKAARVLLANQRKAFEDPVSAAYVDASYGAIQGDSWLKTLWERQRRALVEGHEDVQLVELDMIPMTGSDSFAFSSAVRQAQASNASRFGGPQSFAPGTFGAEGPFASVLPGGAPAKRKVETIDFDLPIVPTKPKKGLQLAAGGTGEDAGGSLRSPGAGGLQVSGSSLVALAALGGLGYLLVKGRK